MNAARNGPSAQKPADADEEPGAAAKALSNILERGARVQAPAVEAYVQRLRRANPGGSPAEIITKLEKRYLAAVMASGAAVGSAAAFPGIGTIAALSAVAGETVVFLEATALFVLAVAEVHGIPAGHREHRRALVLSVLVGDDSKGAVRDLVGPGRTNGAWLGESTAALPLPVVSQLNNRLLKYFVKRYALRRGAIAFGKMLPMGIGAVIGGGGNRLMGKKIISNARTAFGPPPGRWPVAVHVLPSARAGASG
ncbi:MAG: hypothetical protein QOC62_4225 [Mycobacterium sp.]|jgi:hypothetical protein|nr:hypothetical protein [Mycobacterium sp.]